MPLHAPGTTLSLAPGLLSQEFTTVISSHSTVRGARFSLQLGKGVLERCMKEEMGDLNCNVLTLQVCGLLPLHTVPLPSFLPLTPLLNWACVRAVVSPLSLSESGRQRKMLTSSYGDFLPDWPVWRGFLKVMQVDFWLGFSYNSACIMCSMCACAHTHTWVCNICPIILSGPVWSLEKINEQEHSHPLIINCVLQSAIQGNTHMDMGIFYKHEYLVLIAMAKSVPHTDRP